MAEGVETPEHLRMVREAGCDLAQGWLLGQAMPAEEIPRWVRAVQAAGGDLCALAWPPATRSPGRVIGRRAGRRATAPAGPPRPATERVPEPPRTGAPAGAADCSRVRQPRRRPRDPDRPRRRSRRTAAAPALDLLIWDAPNIDMTLSTVIGARPTAASRPRFDAIAAWFVEGAGDPTLPDAPDVEACVFANIPPQPGTLQRWVEALRGFGFAVFARPKTQPDDDIDQDMLDHIAVRAHSHRLRRLVVFSGDGRNFAEPLEQLVRDGTHVVVVAFSEVAGLRDQLGPARVHRHRGRPRRVRRAAGPGAPRRAAAGRRLAAADPQPAGLRQQLHRPPGPLSPEARSAGSPARGGCGDFTPAQAQDGRSCRWGGVIAGLVPPPGRGAAPGRRAARCDAVAVTPADDADRRAAGELTSRSTCGTSRRAVPGPAGGAGRPRPCGGPDRLLRSPSIGRSRVDAGRPHRRTRAGGGLPRSSGCVCDVPMLLALWALWRLPSAVVVRRC